MALFCGVLWADQKQPKEQAPAKEQAPPEEDETLQPRKEYAFNPLQAEKEVKTGQFY